MSELLRVIRLSGTAFIDAELTAPWAVETPPPSAIAARLASVAERIIPYHFVAHGACCVQLKGQQPVELAAGHAIMRRAAEKKKRTRTVWRRQLRTHRGSPARQMQDRRHLGGWLGGKVVQPLTVLALLLPAAQVQAERRALVIGNDAYRNVPALHTARADAEAVARTLESVGFKVTLKEDLSQQAMKATWRGFKQRVSGGDDVVFYYAGHGVQLRGTNYLIPTDLEVQSEDQVTDDSLPLQRILDDLSEQKARFTLAIIDACRDNPFKGTGRGIGGRGLAMVPAATGQMVLYSAGSGQEALDRLSRNDPNPNGVFTRVLIKEMIKPGVSAGQVLSNVRTQVVALARSTNPPHEQVPALYDQTENLFYFVPPTDQGATNQPSIAPSQHVDAAAAAPSPSTTSPNQATSGSAARLIPVQTLPEGTYPGAYEESSASGIWHTTSVHLHPYTLTFGDGSYTGDAWLKFTSAENLEGKLGHCPGQKKTMHYQKEGTAQGRVSSDILEVRLDCETHVVTLRVDLKHPQ